MNTNVIPLFTFNAQQLRCTLIDGEPWFVAADACRCLALQPRPGKGTYEHHLRKLDDDEKRLVTRNDTPVLFTGVRGMALNLVSRPGLFKLIQRSNKPQAEGFRRWLNHEVLPQIMDNGGYMTKDADVQAVVEAAPYNAARSDIDLIAQMASVLAQAQARLAEAEQEKAQLAAEVEQAAPKVEAFEDLMDAKGSMGLQQASRALGLKANDLAAILRARKVLYVRRGANIAYAQYCDAGYFVTKTGIGNNGYACAQTRVTPKGLEWLRKSLKRAA